MPFTPFWLIDHGCILISPVTYGYYKCTLRMYPEVICVDLMPNIRMCADV